MKPVTVENKPVIIWPESITKLGQTLENTDQVPADMEIPNPQDLEKDLQEDNHRLTKDREAIPQVRLPIRAVMGPTKDGQPSHRGDIHQTDRHQPDTSHQVVTSPGLSVVHQAEDLPNPAEADLPAILLNTET